VSALLIVRLVEVHISLDERRKKKKGRGNINSFTCDYELPRVEGKVIREKKGGKKMSRRGGIRAGEEGEKVTGSKRARRLFLGGKGKGKVLRL